MKRLHVAAAAALAFCAALHAAPADARPSRMPVIACNDRGCVNVPAVATAHARRQVVRRVAAVRHASRHPASAPLGGMVYDNDGRVRGGGALPEFSSLIAPVPRAHQAAPARASGTIEVSHDRPRDCYGIQWCGCWLRHHFGFAAISLNLAINWARMGQPASPHDANVVVWRHHVGRLLEYRDGMILVQSGNDGGAVRTRWLSPRVLGGVVAYRRV